MKFDELKKEDIEIIKKCLHAAAYGPFFIDQDAKDDPFWEIGTLFGLEMKELREIADSFPECKADVKEVDRAVSNSINHLLGYPHKASQDVWDRYIPISADELEKLLDRITGKSGGNYITQLK